MFIHFKKPKVYIPTAVIAIIFIYILYFIFAPKAVNYNFSTASMKDVKQEVSVTGVVKPEKSVNLAFEKSGKISRINVEVGVKVSTWQSLASLSNGDYLAQLEQAKAGVMAQEAKLQDLLNGSRPEETAILEDKVKSAEITMKESVDDLVAKMKDSYAKADDSIRNKTDVFWSNPRTSGAQLSFYVYDSQLNNDLVSARVGIESILNDWKILADSLFVANVKNSDIEIVAKNLDTIQSFLSKEAMAVNALSPSSSLTQTTIDTWKSNVSTARTNIATTIASFTASRETYRTAVVNLSIAEKQLSLDKAGATSEAILVQQASLDEAKAGEINAEAQLSKTIIYAPFDGIITSKNFEVGEIVNANSPVISLISENKFKIEANIQEADISYLKIGDIAKVTLDAYGDEAVFTAKVAFIDPAETVIEGVSTYKTTFYFTESDSRIKSGMTANMDILTAQKTGVLAIPQRSVFSKGSEKFVKILSDDEIKEVQVSTGLKGSDGLIEILGGISEGDKVLIGGNE